MLFHVDWIHYAPLIGSGVLRTLELTVLGFAAACLMGMIVALARTSKFVLIRAPAIGYDHIFKNLPIVAGIFIVYFGLTGIGLYLNAFTAGVICLALFYGAYLAEIFRGALEGLDHGQTEAAWAVGLGPWRVFASIRLPQAIRLALPATTTILIDLLKGTSLLVLIGAGELMTGATVITAQTFRPMTVYVVIGIVYLILCWPLSQLAKVLERMLHEGRAFSPLARRTRKLAEAKIATPAHDTTMP